MIIKLIRWYLKRKIAYINKLIDLCHDDAEINRDGRSKDYWEGKSDGLDAALILCNLKDIKYEANYSRLC